jgi:poly(A) RNA polymerase GLD2
MLCDIPFEAEKQTYYDAKYGVVFSDGWGERHTDSWEKWGSKLHASLTNDIDEIWHKEKMTEEDRKLRDKFMNYLSDKLDCVYPNAHLLCGGSSISTCGSIDSDMDLCMAIKTSETATERVPLPIYKYSEEINKFIVDRMNFALRPHDEIKEISVREARVPIVKFKLNANVVDPNAPDKIFEFDINCNCVAGIYNSYLLGGLANFDERFPKLAIIVKKWAENVSVRGNSRFNGYLLTLLLVHYLQCGVSPPVLPNLMKLCPKDYDGTKEPWELTTNVDKSKLPESANQMSVGALLCGFFRYYTQFDFKNYGILIKDASVITKSEHGRFGGECGSMVFVEEPYDGLTVSKNVDKIFNFDHIMHELQIARHLLHPNNESAPRLENLLGRHLHKDAVTKKAEVDKILKS